MKTFFWIYSAVQFLLFLYWLRAMLTTKPTFNKHQIRFIANWKEGGNYLLLGVIIVSILISIGLAKLYLWMNFLENN